MVANVFAWIKSGKEFDARDVIARPKEILEEIAFRRKSSKIVNGLSTANAQIIAQYFVAVAGRASLSRKRLPKPYRTLFDSKFLLTSEILVRVMIHGSDNPHPQSGPFDWMEDCLTAIRALETATRDYMKALGNYEICLLENFPILGDSSSTTEMFTKCSAHEGNVRAESNRVELAARDVEMLC
jgi:hypothetical protein